MNKQTKIEGLRLGILCGFVFSIMLSLFCAYNDQYHYTVLYSVMNESFPLKIFRDFAHVEYGMLSNTPYSLTGNLAPVPYFPFTFVLACFFRLFDQNRCSFIHVYFYILFYRLLL